MTRKSGNIWLGGGDAEDSDWCTYLMQSTNDILSGRLSGDILLIPTEAAKSEKQSLNAWIRSLRKWSRVTLRLSWDVMDYYSIGDYFCPRSEHVIFGQQIQVTNKKVKDRTCRTTGHPEHKAREMIRLLCDRKNAIEGIDDGHIDINIDRRQVLFTKTRAAEWRVSQSKTEPMIAFKQCLLWCYFVYNMECRMFTDDHLPIECPHDLLPRIGLRHEIDDQYSVEGSIGKELMTEHHWYHW